MVLCVALIGADINQLQPVCCFVVMVVHTANVCSGEVTFCVCVCVCVCVRACARVGVFLVER